MLNWKMLPLLGLTALALFAQRATGAPTGQRTNGLRRSGVQAGSHAQITSTISISNAAAVHTLPTTSVWMEPAQTNSVAKRAAPSSVTPNPNARLDLANKELAAIAIGLVGHVKRVNDGSAPGRGGQFSPESDYGKWINSNETSSLPTLLDGKMSATETVLAVLALGGRATHADLRKLHDHADAYAKMVWDNMHDPDIAASVFRNRIFEFLGAGPHFFGVAGEPGMGLDRRALGEPVEGLPQETRRPERWTAGNPPPAGCTVFWRGEATRIGISTGIRLSTGESEVVMFSGNKTGSSLNRTTIEAQQAIKEGNVLYGYPMSNGHGSYLPPSRGNPAPEPDSDFPKAAKVGLGVVGAAAVGALVAGAIMKCRESRLDSRQEDISMTVLEPRISGDTLVNETIVVRQPTGV